MLSQRKRFNYMINNSHTNNAKFKNQNNLSTSSNFKSVLLQSSTKADKQNIVLSSDTKVSSLTSSFKQEKHATMKYNERQNLKKIQQLQNTNKKLIEETTLQFKKLEADVHSVQKILQEKQVAIVELKKQKRKIQDNMDLVCEEKKILIEAIFEKDLVIKQYQMKIKQLLSSKSKSLQQNQPQQIQIRSLLNQQFGSQTDPQQETVSIQQYNSIVSKNIDLQEETYKLKQELFDATNKSKLLVRQFEAYKILKQIQHIQDS